MDFSRLPARAELRQFIQEDGSCDYDAFHHDIAARLLTDHVGFDNGITTRALVMRYVGYNDIEAELFMGQAMQQVRAFLMNHGVIVANTARRWHCVGDTDEALRHLIDRTLRVTRAYTRTRKIAVVAQATYQLPADNAVVQALDAGQPAFEQLVEAAKGIIPPPGP